MDPTSILDSVDRFQRRRSLPAVAFGVIKRFGEHGAGSLAATIAYYGFFSLFPLLLVFVSITGFILKSRPDLQHELLNSALAQFPVVGAQIQGDVGSIQGSGPALAIGLVLALWSGIGGVRAVETALDTVGDVQRQARRGAVASVGMALLLLVALGAFLLGGAFLAGIASRSGSWISSVGLIASGLLNVALFATAYRLLVSETPRWSTIAPGAILAGIGWTVLLVLGSRLVTAHIASASEMYGTFAIVIGLLGWIYLGAQLTLIGAELNVVLAQRLWPRSLRGALGPADEAALRGSAMQEQRNPQEQVSVEFLADPSSEHKEDRMMKPGGERRSTGTLVHGIFDGVKQLARREFELARIEATEVARERAVGVGLLAGSGLMALFALGFLAAAGMLALALVLPTWAAALIVGGVFVIAGGCLLLAGRAAMHRPADVKLTRGTLEEDVRWAKQQIKS